MQHEQWLDRWKQNRIAFHESRTNPYLARYLPEFILRPGDRIFMPLCGKAHDIAWLAQQGFQVVGVELSEIAIESFFSEQGLRYQQFESDRFVMRQSGNISLLQGDFFELQSSDLAACKLVYDRASLIAIDESNRDRYAAHLVEIMPPATDQLLITMDYDQSQMKGPPYAVSRRDINRYYGSQYRIERFEVNDILDERPRWREQGLTALSESVFRLSARPS